jgi:hypothetical protein
MHQAPFEVTINRKQTAQDSRKWSTLASAVVLLLASMVFILAIGAAANHDRARAITVESGSVELATQNLAEANLCQTGIHQSPIDLPDSGTRLDELPFFGWSDDSTAADAQELFEGNTFQVFRNCSIIEYELKDIRSDNSVCVDVINQYLLPGEEYWSAFNSP